MDLLYLVSGARSIRSRPMACTANQAEVVKFWEPFLAEGKVQIKEVHTQVISRRFISLLLSWPIVPFSASCSVIYKCDRIKVGI